jgi:integrase
METQKVSPYELFLSGISNKATRKAYEWALGDFIRFCRAKESDDLLQGTDEDMTNRFQSYILHLKGDNISKAKRNLCFAAVKLFYVMNDRNLKYERLAKSKKKDGDDMIDSKTIPYTKDQIERMLSGAADDREKAIILLFATSGIRLGALPQMKIADAETDQKDILALTVYRGHKEQYLTFATPQTTLHLRAYFKKRFGSLDKIDMEKPLIANAYYPEFAANEDSLGKTIRDILIRAEIRPAHGDPSARHDNQRVHGFRKFFGTTLAQIGTTYEHRERLLGHITGLDQSYIHLGAKDLSPSYRRAIPDLTFQNAAKPF